MAGATLVDKLFALKRMLVQQIPYHCAVLDLSFRRVSRVLSKVRSFPGVVYASYGHWGTLVSNKPAPNWILDQHNADVDFWRVYASQAPNLVTSLAAQINYLLAKRHFPSIYANVGRIISVCEDDRQLTQTLAPNTSIDVIENGVDCSYLTPDRIPHNDRPHLLFTGTSAGRNVMALRRFVQGILPLIQHQIPNIELLVAGNFSEEAQAGFVDFDGIRFTGRVDDIRPYFNQSDVYIAPFEETHGSKLKIAEAMAMAMPIVSTPQGIRGFKLVDNESVLIARNEEDFAEKVVSLIHDPLKRQQLGSNARNVALATIDWPVLGEKLIRIVQETMASIETT